MNTPDWPLVPWSTVLPGDTVWAADAAPWRCTNREGSAITLARDGRQATRRAPAGRVRVLRGEHGREMARVAAVLIAQGFMVDVLDG